MIKVEIVGPSNFEVSHTKPWMLAIKDGFARHGIPVTIRNRDGFQKADLAVFWGHRARGIIALQQEANAHYLVVERGYVGDRFSWTSLGFDGLNGKAKFPVVDDPARWAKHHAHLMQDWRQGEGYALILSQVSGDASIEGVGIHKWYQDVTAVLKSMGWDVRFRQHPVEVERQVPVRIPDGAKLLNGTLDDALKGAALAVTYNSNSAVDAVLAGIPTYAHDEGSMAWDVTSREFYPKRPDRQQWAERLAWCQWKVEEIRSGQAWDVVRTAVGW